MSMVPSELIGRPLTLADYQALPDDQDYEILDGVLYVAPRPFFYHQNAGYRLARQISAHADAHGLGQVVLDADLILDDRNHYLSPDLMFFSTEKWRRVNTRQRNSILPDLVVEILSESTASRDQIVKRRVYAQLEIPHYWIIDAGGRPGIVELVLGADGEYRERRVAPPDAFRPELFPGLEIDLTRLFDPA